MRIFHAMMARVARPRLSLRGGFLILTLLCVALGWRALCSSQLSRFTNAAGTNKSTPVIALLGEAQKHALEGYIALDEIDSLRLPKPDSAWRRELAVWGLHPVGFVVKSKPLNVKASSTAGLEDYNVNLLVFETELRPWGLSKLRPTGEVIANETRPVANFSRH